MSSKAWFAALVVGASLAAVLFHLLSTWPPASSSDAAAWAQAATATGAIVFALFASLWQHHLQIQREDARAHAARKNHVAAGFHLASFTEQVANDLLKDAADRLPSRWELLHGLARLKGIDTAFRQYRPDIFNDGDEFAALMSVVSVRNCLEVLVEDALGRHGEAPGHQAFVSTLKTLIDELQNYAKPLQRSSSNVWT